MVQQAKKVPGQAWVVVFAGTAVNLCLGILYAWSVWAKALVDVDKAGQPMIGLNEGWTYLTNAQASTPFSLAVMIFALFMIPGGRIHDRFGPKVGAMVGGLCLAAGCIIAGLMKSYAGLIIGFGILGGIGMGIGYAAPTPAALKWFGPHKRGLIAGLVVGGYGGAAGDFHCCRPIRLIFSALKIWVSTTAWSFLAGALAFLWPEWPGPLKILPEA